MIDGLWNGVAASRVCVPEFRASEFAFGWEPTEAGIVVTGVVGAVWVSVGDAMYRLQ